MPACKVCGRWFAKIRDDEELCDKCEISLSRLSGYAVPVVRCRECSKWQKKDTTWLCRGFGYCTECMMGCHADNYCSYGERKEGTD